jgi:lysozyme family protein
VPLTVTGGPHQHTDPDWIYWNFSDDQSWGYIKMIRTDSGDVFWFYPTPVACAGGAPNWGTATKNKIKQIQQALNSGTGATLSVDGVWGPRTCSACYAHQTSLGITDEQKLLPEFFESLGLPASYEIAFRDACKPWYAGAQAAGPTPSQPSTPSPVTVPTQPVVAPAPAPVTTAGVSPKVLLALVGAALLAGGLYAMGKKRKGKGKKKRR